MTGNETPSPIEISGDEDWKSRVKSEDAALDQRFGQEQTKGFPQAGPTTATDTAPSSSESQRQVELPDASFGALLGLLSTQAMVGLGMIANPATRKPERDLETARYFIDLLGLLEKKTTGNLTHEEADALVEVLHSLRMAYVELSKA